MQRCHRLTSSRVCDPLGSLSPPPLTPTADAEIRCDQLNLSLLWAQLFQDGNTQPGDIVAFDVYCGDLNFDNSSPGALGKQVGGRCRREMPGHLLRCPFSCSYFSR